MEISRRTILGAAFSTLGATAWSQAARGSFPVRPITIVIPAVPGGSAEMEMRVYAQKLTEWTGERVVFEHRPGAGGTIAAGHVVRAKPDGYTLLQATGDLTTAPVINKQLGFDPVADLAHISVLGKRTSMLLVHPSLPFRTARQYFEYAQANPGRINFGSVGNTARVGAEWMHAEARVKVTLVDYKGTGAMMPDLLAGRIDATLLTPLSSRPFVTAGTLRTLGLTTRERLAQWPEVPTLAEQGLPSYDYSTWTGIAAPAHTPADIVLELSALFRRAAQDPAVREKLDGDYVQLVASGPEEAGEFVRAQIQRWRSMPGLASALGAER